MEYDTSPRGWITGSLRGCAAVESGRTVRSELDLQKRTTLEVDAESQRTFARLNPMQGHEDDPRDDND
jgi:hypothetical protein